MSYVAFLNNRITVQRPTTSQDTSGGEKKVPWVVDGDKANIPANIQSASSDTRQSYAQQRTTVTHTIFINRDIDVSVRHRIIDRDGKIYLVKGYPGEATGGLGSQRVITVDVEQQL